MDFWRQFDIVRPNEDLIFPVTVIGCGGIGSPTTLALAKMGCNDITVYDDDTIEDHNLPNQIYMTDDVGKLKVESLQNIVHSFTGTELKVHRSRVGSENKLNGVVISGVDSMEARKEVWKSIKFKPAVQLYIDARMGAEVCRIYSINPTNPVDVKYYESSLYDDDKAQELPCTGRAIIYNVFMIAALICNQVKKFARGEKFSKEVIFDLATLSLLTT